MLINEIEHLEIREETPPFFLLFDPKTFKQVSNSQTKKLLTGLSECGILPDEIEKLLIRVKTEKDESHFEWRAASETFLLQGKLLDSGKVLITGQPLNHYLAEKQTSALKEARQVMDTINLTIIHELRRPLYNILLGLEDLKSSIESPSEETKEQFSFLERNLLKIQLLIDKLSYRDTVMAVCKSRVDFNELVQQTLVEIQDDIRFTSIQLEVNIEKGQFEMFLDRDKITMALNNILLNAVEAVDPKSGKITISSQLEENSVELTVSDNGCGIPEAHQCMLFHSYFTTKANGMGLGLATAKRIFDAHNIRMIIDSEEKKGSTFTLRFPLHSTTKN